MAPAMGTWVLVLFFTGNLLCVDSFVVKTMTPTSGSYNGGTRIAITGVFPINVFNSGVGEPTSEFEVLFVGSSNTYNCDVEKDSTHERQIGCYTRPMPIGNYNVRVKIDNEIIDSTCGCVYSSTASRTPLIQNLYFSDTNEVAGPPASLITITGRLYTEIYGSNSIEFIANGNERAIRRVYAGPEDCNMLDDSQDEDTLYGLELNENSDFGTMTCRMNSEFVGHNNYSFIVTDYGRSAPELDIMYVTGKDKIYMYETHAEITGISPSVGSVNGGTTITITGNFFDPQPLIDPEVYVGGQPCEIIDGSLTESEIKCVTSAEPPVSALFPGSRGVLVQKWTNAHFLPEEARTALINVPADYTALQDAAGYHFSDTNTIVRITGIFEVPVDDWYQFYMRVDDTAKLYMSCDGNDANAVEVASVASYSPNWTSRSSQRTEWMDLTKGQLCYFEGIVRNYGGPGALDIGVLRATTTLTSKQSVQVYDERQDIRWYTAQKLERQTLTLSNWTATSAIDEVQEVEVLSDCFQDEFPAIACASAFFTLQYRGRETPSLTVESSANEVKQAIEGILFLDDHEITVSRADVFKSINGTSVQGGTVYTITFIGELGDYEDLIGEGSGVSINVSEITKGLPEFTSFSIDLFGRETASMPIDASAERVQSELNLAKGAQCPGQLLGNGALFKEVMDYEVPRPSWEHGWRVYDIPAFCGSGVLRSPYYVFDQNFQHFTRYRADDYPWFCFAHRGMFVSRIILQISYMSLERQRTHYATFFSGMVPTSEDEWLYECYNLRQAISDVYPDATETEILRIGAFTRVSNTNFYIDAVLITSQKPDPLQELLDIRIPPLMHQGKLLKTIEVAKPENEATYHITINPYDCAYEFPLLSVYNARDVKSSVGDDFALTRATNWPDGVGVFTTRTEAVNIPMTGTFDISYEDDVYGVQTLFDIPASISAVSLKAILETLHGFGDMTVGDRGTCYARRFRVIWESNGGNKNVLQINDSNISGEDDLSYSHYEEFNGGVLHGPLLGDMTRQYFRDPQVEVVINGIQSSCETNCTYEYSESVTPQLNSSSPPSGLSGTSLTIAGTNLDETESGSSVMIGDVACIINSHTATEIICQTGSSEYGVRPITVLVGGKGYAGHPVVPLTYTQNVGISGVNPAQSFTTGGIVTTVSGDGFSEETTINIGTYPCEPISTSPQSVDCLVPPHVAGSVDVTVSVTGVIFDTLPLAFMYSDVGLPVVTSVIDTAIMGPGGDEIQINGLDFPANASTVVEIGGEPCSLVSITDTVIICTSPYLVPGTYNLEILFVGLGLADITTNSIPSFVYDFKVVGTEPSFISLFGGTEMTIYGIGFDENTSVTFGDIVCDITTASGAVLTCISGTTAETHVITNDGIHPVAGSGYAWDPNVLTIIQGDTIKWEWAIDPLVAEINGIEGIVVYESEGPGSDEQKDGGFMSPGDRSIAGEFQFTFSTVGTYYYSTGFIDDPDFGSIALHGTINVHQLQNTDLIVSVSSQGIDAEIDLTPVRKKRVAPACTPLTEGIDGCPSLQVRKKRETRHQRAKRGIGSPEVLTDALITEIVNDHNNARASVDPPGSDIILMRWDDELATAAQNYSQECTWDHSPGRTHSYFTSVGENLAIYTRTQDLATAIQNTVELWDNERQNYTYATLTCDAGAACGHYTQVVWHDSYAVGCGVANCEEDELERDPFTEPVFDGAYLVVCQYGYAGNFGGQPPYTEGVACTNCPVEFPYCDDNYPLCTEAEPTVTDPDAEIIASVCHTPVVSSISPNFGIMGDMVTIEGIGFGDDSCRITVAIGNDVDCIPSFTSNTKINCTIDPNSGAAVGIANEVMVNVLGYGNAFIDIGEEAERRFALLPSVSGIIPGVGSINGGTSITLNGAGFLDTTEVAIVSPCAITLIKYFKITCTTPAGAVGIQDVLVSVDGFDAACTTACEFEYSLLATPNVEYITPTVVEEADKEIYINGTGFVLGGVAVYVGDVECNVDSSSSSEITCIIAELAAGDHTITVHVDGSGYADIPDQFEIIQGAAIATMTPLVGGTEGSIVQFHGNGFSSDDLIITFDGVECEINAVTNFMVECVTPPSSDGTIATVQITSNSIAYPSLSFTYDAAITPVITGLSSDSGTPGMLLTLDGALLNETDVGSFVLIGDTACPILSQTESQIQCTVQEPSVGGEYKIVVFVSGRGFVDTSSVSFTYVIEITGFTPEEGSHGGGNAVTISGSGFSSDTKVTVGPVTCAIYDDDDELLPGASVNYSDVTCIMESSMMDPSIDIQYPITVEVSSLFTVSHNTTQYTFSAALTPVISNVNPSRGGTGGGTIITITGTGFSSTTSDVSVTIDGSVCDVTTSSDTSIVCTTNSHEGSIKTSVTVFISAKGQAYDDGAEYFYIDVWSSIFTWGGRGVPGEGTLVVIPEGQTIMIDEDTEILEMLLIDGGTVIFDEKDIELKTDNILIMGGGHLQIGTEDAPFEHKAIITLHGFLRDIELPIYGTKTLAVREGTLDLHGRHIPVPWTYLAATAAQGSSTIVLATEVTWEAEDEIVIASTGGRHSQAENEKKTILNVNPDGVTITLTSPLDYEHLGVSETLPDGTVIEARAEVGLLTRNVVVRGSRNLEWVEDIPACPEGFDTGEFATQTCFQGRFGEEMGSDQFGGQIMFHHPSTNVQQAFGHIDGVELYYMGQAFRLGRYAIHFHIMGDMNYTNYVRRCAIHETFNRAVTIHHTHRALVEHNVVYDAMGGAVFIEDGIETQNIIQHNLVVFCKQSTSLQNDDITPAAFWVTNPNNIIRHNAAAGGTHFGYWYRMHVNPDGPSFTTDICQQREILGEFYNNTAHSIGWYGLWVFQKYTPKVGGCCSCAQNLVVQFRRLIAWNCERGAELVQSGSLQLWDFVIFNARLAGVEIKMLISTEWGEAGLYNSVIVGHSSISDSSFQTQSGLILPYADGWMVDNVTFINFDRAGGSVIATTTIIGTCLDHCGGFHSRFRDITYHNANRLGRFRWEHENYIEDMDGSLTNSPSPRTVIAKTNTAPPACQDHADWGHGAVGGMVCPEMRLHRMAWNNVFPTALSGSIVNLTNAYGTTQVVFEKKRMTHAPGWMALLFDGEPYEWKYAHLEKIGNITYEAAFYNYRDMDCTIMRHQLTQTPDHFNIAPGQEKNSTLVALDCATNYYGDYYFDPETKLLEYMVNGRDPPSKKKRGIATTATWADPSALNRKIDMNTFRCYYKDCIPPPDPNTQPPARERPDDFDVWSDPTIWDGNVLPIDGETVTIISGSWVVADIELPIFDTLWIDGVLELDWEQQNDGSYKDFVIEATYIFIRGGRLIIGWEDNLFRGLVSIILHGDKDTEEFGIVQGVNMGAKAIGVFGGLDMHGIDRLQTWVRLAETASAGTNTITLDRAVDWIAGEEIVITATGYQPWEAETFSIVGINNSTLTLNDTLKYTHLGTEYRFSSTTFRIAAEVGCFTRNIRVIGEDFFDFDKESFGGRILVGQFMQENVEYTGYARISNVEFVKMGQAGYSDPDDPRYSIAFWRSGTSSLVKPSYVRKSAFFRNFNTAIGAFLANEIEISDNVVHHTVGSSIRVEGTGNRLERNLVSLMINPGTYQDRADDAFLWYAGIQTNAVGDVHLAGNVVAGSERAAYWLRGEPCTGSSWGTNIGRASLDGIYINKNSQSDCSKLRNFRLHHNFDFGLYYQGQSSVVIENVLITDSRVGIITLFNGPSATTHVYEDKYADISNTILVAVTEMGICPNLDPNQDYVISNQFGRAPKTGKNNEEVTIGILAPSFMSGHNAAPKKPFPGLIQYPSLGGRMSLQGVTFINYDNTFCAGLNHIAFMTNPSNEDYSHPLTTSGLVFENTPDENRVLYHRPSLGLIDPSNCVDMECDGMKNMLITDTDGSLLGTPGTIISQAEFEWDGDKRRGLGDYRIPKTLLTWPNGSRIDADQIAPNKGILREDTDDTSCSFNADWQAYECHGYNHQLFILESIDWDSETRRLSPVALLSEGYIDLENGPQDHGWCAGYTCQRRLSTFFTTVAVDHQYEVHLTSTNPQHFRLRLPHAAEDEAIVVGIYYTVSNRLDVYSAGNYILPKNGYYSGDKVLTTRPSVDNPDEFMPTTSDPVGTNFYSRLHKTIYITIRGPTPVDIVISNAIFLGFEMPSVTEDEFFDDVLVNLAALLGISADNIWIVDIITEDSGARRKRGAGTTQVIFGVGSNPSPTAPEEITVPRSIGQTGDTVSPAPVDEATEAAIAATEEIANNLEKVTAEFLEIVQTSSAEFLSDALGATVLSSSITEPLAPTSDDSWEEEAMELEESGGSVLAAPIVVPDHMEIVTQPGPDRTPAEDIFDNQPVLKIVDSGGAVVTQLGTPSFPWMVFVDIATGDPEADVFGMTEVPFVDGIASYTNLGIDLLGSYTLRFYVTQPRNLTATFTAESSQITIDPPRESFGNCSSDEGSPRFDRIYTWGQDCSYVCLQECYGGEAICHDVDCCGPHASCISSRCVCNTILEYNGHGAFFSEMDYEELLNPVVNCMPNYIEIRLDKCGMNALGLYLNNLYVFGPGPYASHLNPMYSIDGQLGRFIKSCELNDCRGYLSPSENGVAYSFIIQGLLTDCNAHVQQTATHIVYSNTVRGFGGPMDGPVTWARPVDINFSCKYVRKLFRTLEYYVDPFIRTVVVDIDSEGSFNVAFGIWLDPMYQIPAAGPSVILHVPDYIYLGLEITDVSDAYLFLEECKATLTNDYNDPTHYWLIENGCAADDLTTVAMNGESNVALFAFKAFVFSDHINDTQLWVHCNIQICVTKHTPCMTDCGARRRRSLLHEDTHRVMIGPVNIQLETETLDHSRAKRSIHENYADSFSSMFSTQELSNPPVERTAGIGSVTVKQLKKGPG